MSDASAKRIEDAQGVVKWFDPRKGYGFIVGPDGQDIFVHYSKITGDGYRVLKDGATVTYDAELGDKGWLATRATKVEEGAEVVVRAKSGVSRSPRR